MRDPFGCEFSPRRAGSLPEVLGDWLWGFSLAALGMILVLGAGCQGGGSVLNDTQVKVVNETVASPPPVIYVTDFAVDSSSTGPADESQAATGPIRRRLANLRGAPQDPAAQARELQDLMASTIVDELIKAEVPAQRLAPGDPLPKQGWLLQGAFLTLDEGNRLKRAVIGFGSGALDLRLSVAARDLAANPDQSVLDFTTAGSPHETPGALVFMNPYTAAAKFVMSKNAMGKEVKKAASAIAAELVKAVKESAAGPR